MKVKQKITHRVFDSVFPLIVFLGTALTLDIHKFASPSLPPYTHLCHRQRQIILDFIPLSKALYTLKLYIIFKVFIEKK